MNHLLLALLGASGFSLACCTGGACHVLIGFPKEHGTAIVRLQEAHTMSNYSRNFTKSLELLQTAESWHLQGKVPACAAAQASPLAMMRTVRELHDHRRDVDRSENLQTSAPAKSMHTDC